jgi:hypothetical protein
MTWVIPPVRGLIDPNAAPTFLIDDIGAIRLEGGMATVYYYRNEPCLHGGDDQKVVDVIIKRKGVSLVSSFTKIATFAQYFMMGGPDTQPDIIPGKPPNPFMPRLVR